MNKEKRDHHIAQYGGLSNQGFCETPAPNLCEVLLSHTIKFKENSYNLQILSCRLKFAVQNRSIS